MKQSLLGWSRPLIIVYLFVLNAAWISVSPAGGGRLEVRGDGHRQDFPLGFRDGVRAGNTGTLPPAAHRLHEMRRFPFCSASLISLFLSTSVWRPPWIVLSRSLLQLWHVRHWAPPRFQGLPSLLSAFARLSSGLRHQASLRPFSCLFPHMTYPDLAASPCPVIVHAIQSPPSWYTFFFYDVIITSALLCLPPFFSSPVHYFWPSALHCTAYLFIFFFLRLPLCPFFPECPRCVSY